VSHTGDCTRFSTTINLITLKTLANVCMSTDHNYFKFGISLRSDSVALGGEDILRNTKQTPTHRYQCKESILESNVRNDYCNKRSDSSMVTSGTHAAIKYVTNKDLELLLLYKFHYPVKLTVFTRHLKRTDH